MVSFWSAGVTLDEYVSTCAHFTTARFMHIANVFAASLLQLHNKGIVHGVVALSCMQVSTLNSPIGSIGLNLLRHFEVHVHTTAAASTAFPDTLLGTFIHQLLLVVHHVAN